MITIDGEKKREKKIVIDNHTINNSNVQSSNTYEPFYL